MKKAANKKRLILLDAHAIIHRAYHALPDFTSSKGEPTGALYGLSAMLLKIITDLKPDYLAACYDLPESTYRHEAYEDYKAGRAKIDDELVTQLDRSRDIFSAFHIPIYEHAGFEADDILGTIVEQVKKKKDLEVVIASGDMDTLQLVNKKQVRVYTLKKGIRDTILYDEAAVKDRFGFPPKLLPDYKGLCGDPSDNIVGIPGIGDKTATELIVTFGSIENIYASLKKSEDTLLKRGIKPRVVTLLKEHEEEAFFSKMLAEIRRDAPVSFIVPEHVWEDDMSVDDILELFASLSFRTLADRVRQMFKQTVELDFGGSPAAPSAGDAAPDPSDVKKAALMLWLLSSDITSPTLDDIYAYTGVKDFDAAFSKLSGELKKKKLERVYEDIELPLMPVVARMEEVGIKIDTAYLKKLSTQYHKELASLEKRIYRHAGEAFNINSPRQLGTILFDKLALSVKNQKRTGTGQKSTRESELEKLRDAHPIVANILNYRELQKLLSTYIDNLPGMVGDDGRLHAQFLQAGTTTGRMASQNPNLQNIPIRTELGRNIRNAFVAEKGYRLVALDYSQIELRVAAFLSEDEKLMEIFKRGGDVHTAVAAEVFNVPPDAVDAEMRRRAKVINFGLLYGMGINALRANLGTTRAEAQAFYNDYLKKFSGISHYFSRVKAFAARTGYTETFFGRRRSFEGIRSNLPYVRAAAERMAINAPIQGTEADIIKIAMVRADTYLEEKHLRENARLLLQVHDELVYEVAEGDVNAVVPELKHIMETVLTANDTHGVPIVVDAKVGKSWGEMTSV